MTIVYSPLILHAVKSQDTVNTGDGTMKCPATLNAPLEPTQHDICYHILHTERKAHTNPYS